MKEDHPDDSKIVDLLKNSKEIGCRFLVKKYGNFFTRKATERGLSREDAVSAIDDTFLKVIDKIYTFKPKDSKSFFNWVFTILLNTIRDFYKQDTSRKIKLEFFDESNFEIDEVGSLNVVEKNVLGKIKEDFFSSGISEDQRKHLIVETFNKLSEDERVIFYCYCNGYNLDEMSEYTNISASNLKVKLFRIRKKFVKEINKSIPINQKEVYERIKKIH